MTRAVQIISFTLCVLVSACDTSSSVDPVFKSHFIKYYGGDGDQEATDVLIVGDSILILGTSSIGLTKRIYLAKTDLEGNLGWEKTFGSMYAEEIAQDVELIIGGMDAGRLAVVSNVKKNAQDSAAFRLTIVGLNGDSVKSVLFNQLQSQRAKSVTPLSGGDYFLTGNTTDVTINPGLPSDLEDVIAVRLQSDLSVASLDTIGSSSIGSGIKIFEGSGIFYYAGYSDELTDLMGPDLQYESNFCFRSFNSVPPGTPKGYSGNDSDQEYLSFVAKSNIINNYLAVGTQTISGSSKLYVSLLNSNFTVARENAIQENTEGVAACSSGVNFLVVGNKIKAGGNRNIWVAKVNTSLAITLGPIEFGGTNNDDTASAVAELPNGDIIVVGTMSLVNQKKIALIKLKANGEF
ncbi:MAG: hypothetical protein WAZ98_09120 [Cyclobacteriaceae bacterium]